MELLEMVVIVGLFTLLAVVLTMMAARGGK